MRYISLSIISRFFHEIYFINYYFKIFSWDIISLIIISRIFHEIYFIFMHPTTLHTTHGSNPTLHTTHGSNPATTPFIPIIFLYIYPIMGIEKWGVKWEMRHEKITQKNTLCTLYNTLKYIMYIYSIFILFTYLFTYLCSSFCRWSSSFPWEYLVLFILFLLVLFFFLLFIVFIIAVFEHLLCFGGRSSYYLVRCTIFDCIPFFIIFWLHL